MVFFIWILTENCNTSDVNWIHVKISLRFVQFAFIRDKNLICTNLLHYFSTCKPLVNEASKSKEAAQIDLLLKETLPMKLDAHKTRPKLCLAAPLRQSLNL